MLIALLCATLAPMSVGAAGARAPVAPAMGSWIVTLRPDVASNTHAAQLAEGAGGSSGLIFEHALNGFAFKGSAQAAAALARNPIVRSVVPDGTTHIASDDIPSGIGRIAANHPSRPDAYDAGFRGLGARIAILDTGIDLTHPDLVASLDVGLGKNCMTSPPGTSPPQDGHGHGTHVAGIAAAPVNNVGVVGVAPQARIVPFKVLDDTGYGEWSNLICAIDILTGYATDADPSNDVDVANMSLGDVGGIGSCDDGFVREAICTSVTAGVTYVAAAGNSTVDTSTFIPAAMPEVIAVSAITDLDGEPGGLAGCVVPWFNIYCDDTLAEFSNFGPDVDITAPGYEIYSDWTGGGYSTASGTSMASPHVAGVAALVRAVNPNLSPADVVELMQETGECANGAFADADGTGTCAGKGQWGNDPDGYGEPLANALRAASGAGSWQPKPSITITSPASGSTVSGSVTVTASATSPLGVASVAFALNGSPASTDTDGSNGWAFTWHTTPLDGGLWTIRATATDTAGQSRSAYASVSVSPGLQGDWVGNYGVDGYVIAAWNGTTDLAALPAGVTYTLEQGSRVNWQTTAEVRALESPTQAERRATAWYDPNNQSVGPNQVRVRLNFSAAYSGTIHLYALDWSTTARRETISLDDGSGPRSVNLTTSYDNGAWLHFVVNVPAGGSVLIKADWTAGINALLSGIFLGGSGSQATVPGQPTGLVAAPGNGQVALTWTAPSSDGGSAITGYIATASPGGASCTTASLGCTIGGLTNGTTYSLTVVASNAVGAGSSSSPVSSTPATTPGAPTNLVATRGNGQVALTWTAPASNGGSAITSYTATASPGGAVCTTAGLGCTVSGLINGTTYSFTVVATNGVGPGPASSPVSATPATVPGAPTGLAATPGNGQVTLTWSAPASNGGSPITTYTATASPGGATCTTASLGCTVSSLTNGTTYSFTVRATNSVGPGPASSPITATPVAPANVPGAPTGLKASALRAGGIQLAWTAPASNGGSAITGYRVYRSTSSGAEVFLIAVGVVTSYVDSTAVGGVRYYYKVAAVNVTGVGPPSAEASARAR